MKIMCLLPALLIALVGVRAPILPRALAEHPHQNGFTRQETDLDAPKLVSFPSGDLTLRGFLYKPEGAGPFPAIIWNHGSEKLPGQQPELARFYTKQGFGFFLPHRHGHGRSPGAYIQELNDRYAAVEKNRTLIEKYAVKLHDYGLGPSEILGPVIKRKGSPNQEKIYPPYGTTSQEGHFDFATKEGGIAVWGSDVIAFFQAAIR